MRWDAGCTEGSGYWIRNSIWFVLESSREGEQDADCGREGNRSRSPLLLNDIDRAIEEAANREPVEVVIDWSFITMPTTGSYDLPR